MKTNIPDKDRARKTLYVTGFDPKYITKHLLEELFTQGGPVRDITLFDTHAYVLFQHEESVPYCLALFNEVELHGHKLRLNPRIKSGDAFQYLRYLSTVRKRLMAEYRKIPPPDLPPKKMPAQKQQLTSPKYQPKKQKNRSNKHPPIRSETKSSNKSHRMRPKNSGNHPPKKSKNQLLFGEFNTHDKANIPPPRKSNKRPPKRSNGRPTKKSDKQSSKKPTRRRDQNHTRKTKANKRKTTKR